MGGMTMLSSTSRTPPSRDGWDFCGGRVFCTCAKHDTLFSHRTASQRIPAIEVRIADSSQSHHVRGCYVLKPVLKASKPRHLRENRAYPGTQRQVQESRHFFHSLTLERTRPPRRPLLKSTTCRALLRTFSTAFLQVHFCKTQNSSQILKPEARAQSPLLQFDPPQRLST